MQRKPLHIEKQMEYHDEDSDLISATLSGWSSIEENEKHIEMGADHQDLRTEQVEENDHAEKGNMDENKRSTTIRMVIP